MKKVLDRQCALYCRISTVDKQDTKSQIQSLTSQAIKDGYKEKNITIYKEAVSGFKKKEDRPQLTELLNVVKNNSKHFEVIYVQELSRISRNPKEISDIFYLFVELKQQVFIKSNSLYLLNDKGEKSLVAGILISILAELGQEEARVFKERSSRGLLSSAKAGKAGGGASLAYGYTKDENKMLVIDEEEAKVVSDIYQMYLDGYGGQLIANKLNDDGVLTRYAKTHPDTVIKFNGVQKKGSQVFFSDVVIGSILKNTLYCGKRNFKGEVLPAPAIVSKADFDKVQAMMKTRRRDGSTTNHPYLLKRIDMVCGVCGRRMFGRYKPVKGGDCVYVCSSKFTHEGSCGNTSVNIDFIENVLLQSVKKGDSFNYSFVNLARNNQAVKAKLQTNIKKLNDQLKLEQKQLKSKQGESSKIKQMYMEEIITLTELKSMNEKLKKELVSLDATVKYLNQEITSDTNQLKRNNKPIKASELEKMRYDRTFLRRYFEDVYQKLIINGVNRKEILIQGHPTNESGEFYLLLDKTALLSRYGGDLKYWLTFIYGKDIPIYKNNIMITEPEVVAKFIKEHGKEKLLKKDDMITIKTVIL